LNAHLHPLFAAALRAPIDARALQRAAYVTLLQQHDWSHEFSDDGDVYKRGRAQLQELRLLQRDLDPDGALWNAHAPAAYRIAAAAQVAA
jgi:hypothetical protein